MGFKLTEISGDLFTYPKDFSMAHCVAADFRMGKGIAVKFRDTFGRVEELKSHNVKVGDIAALQDNDRYIYYLVTKATTYQKPTYQNLSSCLESMRSHMKHFEVKKLAIPRIGCGLDGLQWNKVKDILNETFANDDVEITVYNYVPNRA